MRRTLCLLLAVLLAIGIAPAFAEEEDSIILDDGAGMSDAAFGGEKMDLEDQDAAFGGAGMGMGSQFAAPEEEEVELVPYDYDHITIGNATPLNGQFFTDLWGNDTSDIDVRYLLTGYNLIIWDSEYSVFRFDRSVVSGAVVSEDENGDRCYLLSLYSDLFYSDGTPITAWDYAFSILLQASPIIGELGGRPAVFDYIVGYEDYASGSTPYISGVRVPADNIIMITIKKEALPYFYELSRLSFYPYPIRAIAPGCAVSDEGSGAFISNAERVEEPAPFTAELLGGTIFNPDGGFMSHPDPVSGPYRILSYDGETAEFEINPFFKGSEEGKKPRIQRLTFTVADNDDMIRALSEGEYALLNKVAYNPTISEGLRMTVDSPQYSFSTYPRIGLTYLYFNPASALVQEKNVRQAIAHCFDRQKFLGDYVGRYGLETEGLYGLGQWMYDAATGQMAYPVEYPEGATPEEEAAYEEGQAAWDAITLDSLSRYEPDTEAAVRLLEAAGWSLNERGEPFDPQADDVRCKLVDGELRKLELAFGYPVAADLEQAFEDCFAAGLAEAGIRLTAVPMDFDDIVKAHNEHAFDAPDMLYFGDNFNISFDPSLFFESTGAPAEEDSLQSAYEALFALSNDMAHTEPRDILGYMQKWIRFQEQLTEQLPIIPVYTNMYFDFYTRELDEYRIEEYPSWALAIVPARMRSIRMQDDSVGVELEALEDADELDLARLARRTVREKDDYSDGALSVFPAYVREQVPADYKNIYEFVAATLDSELEEGEESLDVVYALQTLYEADEPVYLLYGIPGKGSDVEWFAKEGVGLENGSISTTLSKKEVEQLKDGTFALAVVSR